MLNNHGWGFRAYIILSAILLIALLIACFLITRLYSSIPSLKDGVDGPRTYETVEESIKDATSLYINDYYTGEITTGVVIVSYKDLIDEGFLEKDSLTTSNNDVCIGYARVSRDSNNEIKIEPYINCTDYKTNGYQAWRIVNE